MQKFAFKTTLTSKIFGPDIFGHLIFGQKLSDEIFQDFGQFRTKSRTFSYFPKNFGQRFMESYFC